MAVIDFDDKASKCASLKKILQAPKLMEMLLVCMKSLPRIQSSANWAMTRHGHTMVLLRTVIGTSKEPITVNLLP